jgi:predicted PurR-regulated permease PerM
VAVTFVLVQTREIILMTLAAALIATALHRAVDFLVRHHVKRPFALTLVVLALLGVLAGIVLLLVPPVIQQGQALVEEAPQLLRKARHSHVIQMIEQQLGEPVGSGGASSAIGQGAGSALHVISGFVGELATIVSTAGLVVFILIFGRRLVEAWLAETLPSRRPLYERVGGQIYRSVGRYLLGLGFLCLVNATLTTIFLAIVRIPFFLALGILSGISSLIPYAGPIVAGAAVVLIAFVTRGPWIGLATIIYFVLYGQLEGQALGPIIHRKTVDVDPLITLLSILFMAKLAGVVGAVIAVPAAAAAQIVLREILAARREHLGT